MNESKFVSQVRKKFLEKHPQAHFYKIPDSFGVDGKTRPYDYYYVLDGKFTAVEAKMHKSVNSFSFSKVEPHQIFNLRSVHANKGDAFLLVGVRVKPDLKFKEKYEYSNVWLKMDIYIPIQAIPGTGYKVDYTSFSMKKIIDTFGVKGNVVNEIYLSKRQLAGVARQAG